MAAVGDVFYIPLKGDRVIIGQICAKLSHGLALIAVFKERFPLAELPAGNVLLSLLSQDPLMLASTFENSVKNGAWPKLANISPSNKLKMPAFRIPEGLPFALRIESYVGDRRWARPSQWKAPDGYTVSERWLEAAIGAYFGESSWDKRFDELLYENVVGF